MKTESPTSTLPRRPIGIDLFAGAGGMSLGFEQAGFDIAAAVEIDPIHAAIHHFNFPECAVIPQSVRDLSGDDIRRAAGLKGKVDVVFGGAPCQGFSMIGKRILDDPRNNLVKDLMKAMGHQPQPVREAIPLGDPSLLSMEMSHASAYWGIEAPIQKRDRKSGARKRSQLETEAERVAGMR